MFHLSHGPRAVSMSDERFQGSSLLLAGSKGRAGRAGISSAALTVVVVRAPIRVGVVVGAIAVASASVTRPCEAGRSGSHLLE